MAEPGNDDCNDNNRVVYRTEDELGIEFNQPKFLGDEAYPDDDDFDLPFRFLDQWELRESTSILAVDLPSPETSLVGWTLRGRCVSTLPRDDNDPQGTVQPEDGGWVDLTRLEYYCVDRSRRYRGYWIVTEKAYYWLQQPKSWSHTIRSRAALASLSEIITLKKNEKDANRLAKKSIHDLPIHLDLLRFAKDRVLPHLVKAKPKWTERCKLIRSIQELDNSQSAIIMADTHVKQICETIERNLQQTSWGQPLQMIIVSTSDDESSTTEEEEKKTEEIITETTENKKAKTSSRKQPPSNSSSNEAQKKKNSPLPANLSMDTEESMSSEPEEKDNTMINTTVTGRPLRSRKRVNYAENNQEEEEDEDSSVDRVRRAKSKPPSQKKRKKKTNDDDDDEDASIQEVDASSSDEDELLQDDESSNEEMVIQRRAPPSKQKKKGAAVAKGGNNNNKGKLKMFEAFQPMNAPSFKSLSLKEIQEEKEFLDPCGMEATDDIIDRLVGDQIDKISGLLQRSLESNCEMGSVKIPLKLGTACSGTDAPALALNIIQEQLEKRGMGDLFRFTHEFSCENDPFKQAYLARNFDSILYPDITKLTEETPRDVYGQEQPIPPFNLFVAGTSCKNFSMLRSNKRIDIEDKGCSGETFLAATEVLFQEKPPMAIFENVIRAPWLKMQEYITGRIKLSDCDSNKAISNLKDKNKELTFALLHGKDIVADRVPGVYGVRCGAAVAGFLKPGNSKLQEVNWPFGKNKTECTLTDLMKKNGISKQDDTLVFKTECMYCTHIVTVDTKDYGLPQTRMRTYMLVWRPVKDNVDDDLGVYWEHLVTFLKSPVRHSLQSFILHVDHDIIRVFREALRGPPGRMTMRGVFQEPYFWKSANANLPHNKVARERLGLEDEARFLTKWSAFGQKQIPPHYWLEYLKCNGQRVQDLLEILHAAAMRDAEEHDSSFASFYWNISQNASKEKHRSACPGIAGCITPGGDFFLPHEGRPILGCEKLMMQGIPYFRLVLGNETEVQLGDLAGNAMSLTVVGATILAAMTCNQLRTETVRTEHQDVTKVLTSASQQQGETKTIPLWENVSHKITDFPSELLQDASSCFVSIAALATQAVKSSIWCTCETSGSNSSTNQFLECIVCRVACCRECAHSFAGYDMESHKTKEVVISKEEHDLGDFLSTLRRSVPSTLVFGEAGITELVGATDDAFRVSGLQYHKFKLHGIKRDRRRWFVIYYARVDDVGEAVAEFKISVGELKREDTTNSASVLLGMQGELTSFFPALSKPVVYGKLDPFAVVTVYSGSSEVLWKGRGPSTLSSLELVGDKPGQSFRAEVGLTDFAAKSLRDACHTSSNRKSFEAAKVRGETRRWMYPKNWKSWPDTIFVRANDSQFPAEQKSLIEGSYIRSACRQTTNQSALWVKFRGNNAPPAAYILIKPNVNRTGPDRAIISTTIAHSDSTSIVAILPFTWQPSDSLLPENQHVDDVQIETWTVLKSMECFMLCSRLDLRMEVDEKWNQSTITISGLQSDDMNLLCQRKETAEQVVKLKVNGGQLAQQTLRAFNALFVAPILQFAAEGDLNEALNPDSPWKIISPSDGKTPFGACRLTNPERPKEIWDFNSERKAWTRCSEPRASRKYYKSLENAPKPFVFLVDKSKSCLMLKLFPEVAGHHAAYQLIEGRGGNEIYEQLTVSFRMFDTAKQSDPILEEFRVKNCNSERPTFVQLRQPYTLYDRQQKVVSKMLAIENGLTDFVELEMSEHLMPGLTGLSLAAKAERKRDICGGAICDAIGSGKTVISIAIIVNGIEKARTSSRIHMTKENQSSASLVVVPPALIDQWASEFRKFTVGIKVVQIYDFNSLSKLTVKDFKEADVVICPVDILESKGYLEFLLKTGGLNCEDVPKLPRYSGQKEQMGAVGVWIPATSADPYGGANSGNNQKYRDQSAYFTFLYSRAIQNVRTMKLRPQDIAPLEFFEWERVFIDEIHECLCTTKGEIDEDAEGFFKEKNRRAGRELLGITERNIHKRPLIFRRGIYGLTGTPLLDSASRVTELANLMGNTYIVGLSSHWRKLERESSRDIFLHSFLEPRQSREIRRNIYSKCQEYIKVACCRNRADEQMAGIEIKNIQRVVNMTEHEEKLYYESQSGIQPSKRSFAITPEEFDKSAGHDIYHFLHQNAKFASRGKMLIQIVREILSKDPITKIICFTDGHIGAGNAARKFLEESGLGCTYLDKNDSVAMKNQKISWYQTGDSTIEDRNRPRVLVLHFEHAAGLNLQTESNNVILFSPLYVGEGGSTSDPVSDASTELQAIGRVYRPGQTKRTVFVYRIEVRGPKNEECLDGQLIRRNTDPETIQMAVSAGDD